MFINALPHSPRRWLGSGQRGMQHGFPADGFCCYIVIAAVPASVGWRAVAAGGATGLQSLLRRLDTIVGA